MAIRVRSGQLAIWLADLRSLGGEVLLVACATTVPLHQCTYARFVLARRPIPLCPLFTTYEYLAAKHFFWHAVQYRWHDKTHICRYICLYFFTAVDPCKQKKTPKCVEHMRMYCLYCYLCGDWSDEHPFTNYVWVHKWCTRLWTHTHMETTDETEKTSAPSLLMSELTILTKYLPQRQP